MAFGQQIIGGGGTPGAPGADGLTAYEIAVAEGFVGDETAWLASLEGDPGNPGWAFAALDESETLTLDVTAPKQALSREVGADLIANPATITAPVGHTIGAGQVGSAGNTMDINANIDSLIWIVWDGATNWEVNYTGVALTSNTAIARPDNVDLGNLGSTETITASPTTAQVFTGVADANLTLTVAGFGATFAQPVQLIIDYDGSAQRTLTFVGVDWWDGDTPTNGPDTGERIVLTFTDVGDGDVIGTLVELVAA